jgi:hypothetical protein
LDTAAQWSRSDLVRYEVRRRFNTKFKEALVFRAEVDLTSRGYQPDVSCTWADEPPADHPIVVVHGPPGAEAAYFEGEARAALPLPDGAW